MKARYSWRNEGPVMLSARDHELAVEGSKQAVSTVGSNEKCRGSFGSFPNVADCWKLLHNTHKQKRSAHVTTPHVLLFLCDASAGREARLSIRVLSCALTSTTLLTTLTYLLRNGLRTRCDDGTGAGPAWPGRYDRTRQVRSPLCMGRTRTDC